MRNAHRNRSGSLVVGLAGIGALAAVVAMGTASRYPILQALLAVVGLLGSAGGGKRVLLPR